MKSCIAVALLALFAGAAGAECIQLSAMPCCPRTAPPAGSCCQPAEPRAAVVPHADPMCSVDEAPAVRTMAATAPMPTRREAFPAHRKAVQPLLGVFRL